MLGKIVKDSAYFQHLLTSFSTPEELFGVLSLKDLEQGIYKRNMKDMLPLAHFGFIDEIFKANSAILNSLLILINERIYYNNGVPVQSPLMTIVGSSNEYIEEVYDTLGMIRQELQDEGIRPSDRRFKQSISLLKARAYLEARLTVTMGDLKVLVASLWETVD